MSHSQLIKDTLNILDLTIHFEENYLFKEKYKGQICLIYKGILTLKETTARLKHPSHSQRSMGRKLTCYWKLLQKEEAE